MSKVVDIADYATVAFDCDGVILNSNRVKTEAFFTAALPYYGQRAAAALRDYHVSRGGISRYRKFEHFLTEIVGVEPTTERLTALLRAFADAVLEGLLHCEVAPGLADLRATCPDQRWLVVSGGDQQELRDVFRQRDLARYFDGGVHGSPATKEEILAAQLSRGGIAHPALFLGDSRYDAQAADHAGMAFVFVSGWTELNDWRAFVAEQGCPHVQSLDALRTAAQSRSQSANTINRALVSPRRLGDSRLSLPYKSSMPAPEVSVVIGSLDRLPFLQLTIDAVRTELRNLPHEIFVVDGGSTDGTLAWLTQQKDIIAIVQHNRGSWNGKPLPRRSWGYFMNLAFKAAQGRFVCMLSDDSVIHPQAILHGIECFETATASGAKVGAVAFYFRDLPHRKRFAVAVNVGQLYVNHGLYLREAMQSVDFVEEDAFNFYFADTDLALKMKTEGYDCIACPGAFVDHYHNATPALRTSNNEKHTHDKNTLVNRWAGKAFPANMAATYRSGVGYWHYLPEDVEAPPPLPAFRTLISAQRARQPSVLLTDALQLLHQVVRRMKGFLSSR